ncbi:MAG: homoserine kinase [Candidatus Limnocylindrales bacterium]
MTLRSGPLRIDVAATSANLGAGFDALALALSLADIITVERADALPPATIELTVSGEGAGAIPLDGSDRFTIALRRGLAAALDEPRDDPRSWHARSSWRISMQNAIPLGRGLGSSAAVTIAGLVAADRLTGGHRLSQERLLALAIEMEGHPDNAAAVLLGGFTVASVVDGEPVAVRLEPPTDLHVALFIPDRELATSAMRSVLPESVPRVDAVHNVGRTALAVAAIATGRLGLLEAGTIYRLHEPYRAIAYPELPFLTAAARRAGALGACLSGAGSTIIAFADSRRLAAHVAAAMRDDAAGLGLAGRESVVETRSSGVIVTE